MLSRFHTVPACHEQTDRQTDRQTDGLTDRRTDRIAISISRVSVLTRDKNCSVCQPPHFSTEVSLGRQCSVAWLMESWLRSFQPCRMSCKKYIFNGRTQKARSAYLPVSFLLTGRFLGFSPDRGDTVHRWRWNLAFPNFTLIGRLRVVGLWPPKLKEIGILPI